MIPQSTQQKLNEAAQRFGKKFMEDVRATLIQAKYTNRGELLESLKLHITPATSETSPIIAITYADQGYFIGYKNPQWTKLPNIEKLKKWAETKTFSFVPGYADTSNLPPFKIHERVAWAIAKDKHKNDTWKPKRWKKEAGISQLLTDLNEASVNAFAAEVEIILADAITNGTVLS